MNTPKFNSPTLVTLTAPTCAGKNYLLEALIDRFQFTRIVSTTDRPARAGEIQGLHYDFISTQKSKELEADGELAELVTYNGVRYGVTHEVMESAIKSGHPPIVILEPNGLEIYKKYCVSKGWQMFSIFLETQESIRMTRLANRTAEDIYDDVWCGMYTKEDLISRMSKIVQRNNSRIMSMIENERNWVNKADWDVKAPGTDLEKALEYVSYGVNTRNNKSAVYN